MNCSWQNKQNSTRLLRQSVTRESITRSVRRVCGDTNNDTNMIFNLLAYCSKLPRCSSGSNVLSRDDTRSDVSGPLDASRASYDEIALQSGHQASSVFPKLFKHSNKCQAWSQGINYYLLYTCTCTYTRHSSCMYISQGKTCVLYRWPSFQVHVLIRWRI